MQIKNVKPILEDALEEKITSSQINLWPGVRARLVARQNISTQQGEKMNKTKPRLLQRVALTTLMIIVLIVVALITPQGRAFAQDILKFFNRAESNVLPLLPEQAVSPEAAQSLPTAVSPAPLVSVAEAERLARFDAKELPIIPKGFDFAGAMAGKGSISIQYEVQGGGGALIINESTNGFMQSEWDQAPVESISQVKIGQLNAEIVQGAYVVYPGETVARWNSDASILRLRWIEGGIWFEMAKFGGVESIAYLDEKALIKLAESLTNDPFPLKVKEAEVEAAFDVLEPVTLPEGMIFLGSSFDPALKMVSLSFGYSKADRRLLIKQQPVGSREACDLCGLVGASASVESIQIEDVPGEYALGVWELTENGPVWRDNPYLKTIRWQKHGVAFEMIYMGMEVKKEQLIAIAKSMR